LRVLTLGLIGYGAFGRLAAKHLAPHFDLRVYDSGLCVVEDDHSETLMFTSFAAAASSDVVVLAVPLSALEAVARGIVPHLKDTAIVCDVTSVKIAPAEILQRVMPPHIDILCTHPLFGPQSAKNGIKGHKIVVCPVRTRNVSAALRFLETTLKLEAHVATVEEHDRDMAVVQGLTHLIARILSSMGPLPSRLTTSSFSQLKAAAEMVQGDSEELFLTIERANPFASAVRDKFFGAVESLNRRLNHLKSESVDSRPFARASRRAG
jgi:prephenate dehydrogenase